MQELCLYETEQTYISLSKGRVYIKDSKTREISERAITICPGFQIELGRNIKEIHHALIESRVPVTSMRIELSETKKQKLEIFVVIRMNTGKIPGTQIAYLVCVDDIIKTVIPKEELLEDEIYSRYVPLPEFMDWNLPGGRSEQEKKIRREMAIGFLKKRFPKISDEDIIIKKEDIILSICISNNLIFSWAPRDEYNRYIFDSINLLE